ncbi:alpha/beta hydrolase [Mycolicibacterium sp. CH28]|uniref:alpha/beta fold hydrolase n=1 Tax=Mycolicibacterium sp. CH28 TaxID=2512237 RepID=UPI001081E366|nr:alpha/beta hydrolase [Mycolicibacterium sp. CH28]TGD87532.1 alpha/beta hydrolase [Mycolicibacterium sp. CH28]
MKLFPRALPQSSSPSWFATALQHAPRRSRIEVEGAKISLRTWGRPELPPLVFVHGGGGHSGWWDHIAPFFTRTHHVLAPDLSGHGDSDRRPAYSWDLWARELLVAATSASRYGERPIVIGHSMGGWVAAIAASHHGSEINAVVMIDPPLPGLVPDSVLGRQQPQVAQHFQDKAAILASFEPIPSQEVVLPFIGQHLAAQSVRRDEKGWTWKFDPAVFNGGLRFTAAHHEDVLEHTIAEIPCRMGYLWCETGLVPTPMAEQIRADFQLRGPFVELACAGHHPMLDQPLPLIATLRTFLEFWSIT